MKENALPGTVLVKLLTADKDVDMNTSVDFYITAGDPRSQFQVRIGVFVNCFVNFPLIL